MVHRKSKESGAAMILTICVFAILIVLGMNVLSACMSNMNQIKTKYENQQNRLFITSIYETVDDLLLDSTNASMKNCILRVMTEKNIISSSLDINDPNYRDIIISIRLVWKDDNTLESIITIMNFMKGENFFITSTYGIMIDDSDETSRLVNISNLHTTRIEKEKAK